VREPAPDHCGSQYDRPNQRWVCGLAREGHSCPAGPTASGNCPAWSDCTPLRDGARWQCNRSNLRGGMCDSGPTPDGACGIVHHCHPQRSLRAIRGRFVSACALVAAGGVALLLSGNWRDHAIAPGPLSRSHAQLLNRTGVAANCAACHGAATDGLGSWTASIALGHGGKSTQSQLCMECHGKTIASEFATAPHNVPSDRLQEITAKRREDASGMLRRVSRAVFAPGEQLACATCHREHHGSQFDLTAIGNNACQACHRDQYDSFAADHPEFGIWPYERRTRIVFNHASHAAKYFAEKKQSFDCASCHEEGATRSAQLSPGYEAACAVCHDEKIATSAAQGVPMLLLPTLDVEALKAAGHDLGGWPEQATGDFDGRLPPMMKLLLAADPVAAQAIRTLGEDFEFLDIDPDDSRQLAACAALAQAIKQLLGQLATSGPDVVQQRLATALGRQVSDVETKALVAGLSVDTLAGTAASWLQNSAASSTPPQDRSADHDSQNAIRTTGTNLPLTYAPAGTWFRDDAAFAIRYRPAAHADPVLTSWLEIVASTPELAQQPLALSAFKELSSQTAPGLCITCHSVDQIESGHLAINWQALDRTSEPRGFTKFSHGPHLVLPQLGDCTQCHAIDSRVTATATHAGWDPHRFASEFLPMSKNECAECHTATAAGDRCQSCHNYHVESSGLRVDGSGIPSHLTSEP
jgi:hypothetical protein